MKNRVIVEPIPKNSRKFTHILFEKIPAIIFATLFVFLIFGGAIFPMTTAFAIISLNIYFLYKSFTTAITFAYSYFKINRNQQLNWQTKLESLTNPEKYKNQLLHDLKVAKSVTFEEFMVDKKSIEGRLGTFLSRLPKFIQRIAFNSDRRKIFKRIEKDIEKIDKVTPHTDWKDLQHIIIIPHVKEPEHILRATLEYLKEQTLPHDQINVVLAAEERDPDGFPLSLKLAEEFKDDFNNIWCSNHHLTEEEIVGKSSNMKAGGTKAFEEVTKLGWDLKKTLITSCDADSKLPPQYFSYVSYEYCTRKNAEYKYFNAAMVFYNNIWKLPFYARVKNSMSTLISTSRLARPDKLIPFSTYTTSFFIIKEIGFWTPWVTPEDYHLFLKGQFKFGSIVSTIPIFLPIMSDAAEGRGHMDTFKNNYQQERRWAWGISDDGWVLMNLIKGFGKHDFITVYRALHSILDHIIAPILGVLLIVGGNIPPLINPAFNDTVLGAQLPQVSSFIITLSLSFLLIMILIDLKFKPDRENKWGPAGIIVQILEWTVLPVAAFMMSVLPGIEANTRLLFGKHLEYYVTKKH